MIIIWCHDLTDYSHTKPSKIMLSVTQGVTCGGLTFPFILRKEKLHFSKNFNSFLYQLKNRAVRGMLS